MKAPPRVVFLGNHTVGVRTLRVLVEEGFAVGVAAHPLDLEDGVRYESVHEAALELGIPVVRASGRSTELARFVSGLQPDLLWIADYRYILPNEVLRIPALGAVNLHPSLLPKYRGRAPLNWAILKGETRLGLTAHWVDQGMDTGDIIAQVEFELSQNQDVSHALAMLYPLYESLTLEVLGAFREDRVPRRKQDESKATAFPKRTADDGLIDWRNPAREVWNLVRAVAPPYPGAFAYFGGGVLRVHAAAGLIPFPPGVQPVPGTIVAGGLQGERLVVACADCSLNIVSFDLELEAGKAEK
jgi:methionyl-tRNA formyltransferase